MSEIFVANNMQNVYTPLPFKMHFLFCIIATLLYILQFYRKRSSYYIFIMCAIDLTFVTQYYTNKPVIIGLFVAEIILIICAVISSHLYNKKIRAENAINQIESERQKEIEKAMTDNDKKIVDNAFDDKEGL
ncbi:MAG: hypothetical protein Q4D35_03555 [Ruminococcus sp.]|nr:hypothetical protein [Ruminococcus sp.]